jgi:tetratricopeptide (TPR) repeat protein
VSWFTRLVHSESPQPGEATVRSIRFDTTGLRLDHRQLKRVEWHDADGDRIVATVERQTDALGPLTQHIDALRAQQRKEAAARGDGIVSVDVIRPNGLAAAQIVTKQEDRPAYVYEGTLVVPLRDDRFILTMHAREHGVTGTREAVVASLLFNQGLLRIPSGPPESGPRRMEGWVLDPYDAEYDGEALCSLADDDRLDDLFPNHPLSKIRRWLRTVADTVVMDAEVRPRTGEDAWSPSDPGTRISAAVPSATIGLLYLMAGRTEAAEALFAESVTMENGEPAVEDANVANTLTNLGLAREAQGKFVEAEWAFARAHRMFQTTVGGEDIRTVRAGSHLGRVWVALGRFDDAEALLRQALPVFKEKGTDVDVAVASNDMGLICQGRKDLRGAVAYFEKALACFEEAEKEQGTPIADRTTVLNNLVKTLNLLGDRKGATAARARMRTVGGPT